MTVETVARGFAVLLLPALALGCILVDARWTVELWVWLGALALVLAADALGPRVGRAPHIDARAAATFCLAAPLLQGSMLGYALWLVATAEVGTARIAAMAVMLGISGSTIGVSAAHELVHRRSALERAVAQAFMLLVSYPHFPLVHLRVHHPHVGTPADPGTSSFNEPLGRFLGRALVLAWRSGWRIECTRLARTGRSPWHWDNALLRVAAMQAALYAVLSIACGRDGLVLFVGQSAVAIFISLTIDYTQHYGVVRRQAEGGRLERFQPWHAWTSDHASNLSTFNLGLHADHHQIPARRYPELGNAPSSLQAPCGYPGLVLLAMVPALWYRVMNPRLSAGQPAERSGPLVAR